MIFKICVGCKREHTYEGWRELPFAGLEPYDYPQTEQHLGQDVAEVLELRICPCGAVMTRTACRENTLTSLVLRALGEHVTMSHALVAVQARCTELLEDNRRLREELEDARSDSSRPPPPRDEPLEPYARPYYLDAEKGDDAHDGLSPRTAFRTMKRFARETEERGAEHAKLYVMPPIETDIEPDNRVSTKETP